MKDLHTLGAQRERELVRLLAQCPDVAAAQDEAIRWLDQVGGAYGEQAMPARQRTRALGLLAVGKAALEVLSAADRVQILAGLPSPPPRRDWRYALACLPSLLAAIAALWALFLEHNGLCLVCVLSAAAGLPTLCLSMASERRREPQAHPQVSPEQLVRRLSYLLREIDGQLESEAGNAPGAPQLTGPLLEAAQMLLEAQLTGDAQYALKGIPSLADALTRQGIEMISYAPERAQDFDLLPAPVGGRTIRPALRQGGTLLLRGQATIKR